MPTSEEEANALLASSGPSFVGSTIAVPDSSVALEDGYQSQKVSDEEQRKSRKALARRWSEPYSDDGSVDLLDPTRVFWGCAAVALLGCCGTVLFLDETRAGSIDTSKSKPIPVTPLHEMWRILQQRAIWQLVAFHFWHSFLTSVSFSDLAAIQEFWVGVTPLNSSLAGCVSTALVIFATFLMREYFLNASWRRIMFICSFFTTIVFTGVNLNGAEERACDDDREQVSEGWRLCSPAPTPQSGRVHEWCSTHLSLQAA
ncbi:uncharacterized protein KRP23_6623 [Phytophthora ramorum]|uniref:uncharacterized protein n=1 Tax=Phytophthora ramorum TaxID=164328 RepID=UPI0030B16EC8|nr:hypothetical protein KRP23_6623 [Phytophthora ramorum]